jgi:divalent metal cation (Fe/Co/Zn/Cd) transporter
MTKKAKFMLTKWSVGLYVVFVMFFVGVGIMWSTFDWLVNKSPDPLYHVLCFFISMVVTLCYEYWAVRLLDWIADKLDV